MFWSMTTLTTVGCGDILPTSDAERAYAMLAMIVGGAFYGYIVGSFTSMVSELDLNVRACHDKWHQAERLDGIPCTFVGQDR